MKEYECCCIGTEILYVEFCACVLGSKVPGMREYECCYIGIKMVISAYQSKIRVIRPHYTHIARQRSL